MVLIMPDKLSTNVLANAGVNLDVIEESLTRYQYLLLKKFLELEEEKHKFRKLRRFIESELKKLSALSLPDEILTELGASTEFENMDFQDLLAKVQAVAEGKDVEGINDGDLTDEQTHLDDFFRY